MFNLDQYFLQRGYGSTDFDRGTALAQAIVDTARGPLLVLDRDLRVVAASRSFYLTFHAKRLETEGRLLFNLGNGQWDIPILRSLLEKILPERSVLEDYEVEHEFAHIDRRAMLLNARKVLNGRGAHATLLFAIEDVTHRRATERELQELLHQKELLLEEMQHRVANSLQIIASILLLTASTVQSEETRLHLQDAHQRVISMAALQQHLQVSHRGEPIAVAPYLSKLCGTLAQSMIGDSRPVSLEVVAKWETVSSRQAVSIGLIVTEGVMNALKHAFPKSQQDSRIIVKFEAGASGWTLSIVDNGVGKLRDGSTIAKPGLGTGIIKALAQQLEADVEVESGKNGTTLSIARPCYGSVA